MTSMTARAALVYFRFGGTRCVSAEAATLFTAAGVLGLESSLLAVLATCLEVDSFGDFFEVMIKSISQYKIEA